MSRSEHRTTRSDTANPGDSMICVRLFSVLRERAGVAVVEVQASDVRTIGEVAQAVFDRYPGLTKYRSTVRYARNQVYASPDAAVSEGDEIALITPVSGG